MKLNTIYTTFQGEINAQGIGCPAIFLRLQGCHLRCYKKTLGVLCDTPEGLEKPTESDKVSTIIEKVIAESERTGVTSVTLTGGDPLWNKTEDIKELLQGLTDAGLSVSVETSGTISWLDYSGISDNIYWVLDYKLASAGLKDATKLFSDNDHLKDLSVKDYIKFVVMDEPDMREAISAIQRIAEETDANIAVGAYWGGKLEPFDIFQTLMTEGLLGRVVMNFQVHKMAMASDYKVHFPAEI